jgi:hypothetical protein
MQAVAGSLRSSCGLSRGLSSPDPESVGRGVAVAARSFRSSEGSYTTSAVLAELARLWDQAAHREADGSRRLTQKQLAEASGVPFTTVNSWSTGASLPRDLDRLAAVGGVLARWAGEPPVPEREWERLLDADKSAPLVVLQASGR